MLKVVECLYCPVMIEVEPEEIHVCMTCATLVNEEPDFPTWAEARKATDSRG